MNSMLLSPLCFHFAVAAAVDPPPHIIMVLADDQGWGDVGYNAQSQYQDPSYNYTWKYNPPHTPNLDAMARSENSITFHRFYSGSPVCSPTRSALLSGRTPDRDCIIGAEGCGSAPAWSCLDKMPFPEPTFTIGEAAKEAGYATAHIGTWHLGDFFYKGKGGGGASPELLKNDAYGKWPVSNPGMHGFDEWHSTEASAPSSTTNCGCKQEWWEESPGCITGGGVWSKKTYPCTNYWFPLDLDEQHAPSRPECHNMSDGERVLQQDCVGNLTSKIDGDDSSYIMDQFESFMHRKLASPTEKKPFLALLWMHTNHEPHPSLPQFYNNYTDVYGDPAGDYLGTLTQLDVQIGRLRQMIVDAGISDNTMLWYTADNGPHTASRDRSSKVSGCSATNGLRQCKASIYEGGIRVPGMLEWPAMIKQHSDTWHPAYVSDYMPTLLELLAVKHQHPEWAADGISLMPLIKQLAAAPNSNDTSLRPTEHPLVFKLGKQVKIVNNQWAIVRNPVTGQCAKEKNSVFTGTRLFNLDLDPTESNDLSKDPAHVALFANMSAQLDALQTSILSSAINEAQCLNGPSPGPSPSPHPPSPSPSPSPGPPIPPTPPATGSSLMHGGKCLGFASNQDHPKVTLGACDGSSKWIEDPTTGAIQSVLDTGLCLKVDMQEHRHGNACDAGNTLTVAKCSVSLFKFDSVKGSLEMKEKCSTQMCAGVTAAGGVAEVLCSDPTASQWSMP